MLVSRSGAEASWKTSTKLDGLGRGPDAAQAAAQVLNEHPDAHSSTS